MVRAELLQQCQRFNPDATEADYRRVIDGKTAALFKFTGETVAFLVGAEEETVASFARFGRRMGIAFQILDDWLDWAGDKTVTGKAVRADLQEGNPSLGRDLWTGDEPHGARVAAGKPEGRHSPAERRAGRRARLGAGPLRRPTNRVRATLEHEADRTLAELGSMPTSPALVRLAEFSRLLIFRTF